MINNNNSHTIGKTKLLDWDRENEHTCVSQIRHSIVLARAAAAAAIFSYLFLYRVCHAFASFRLRLLRVFREIDHLAFDDAVHMCACQLLCVHKCIVHACAQSASIIMHWSIVLRFVVVFFLLIKMIWCYDMCSCAVQCKRLRLYISFKFETSKSNIWNGFNGRYENETAVAAILLVAVPVSISFVKLNAAVRLRDRIMFIVFVNFFNSMQSSGSLRSIGSLARHFIMPFRMQLRPYYRKN